MSKNISCLIFDMDGVLWKDFEPIGDILWVFKTLQQMNLKMAFATNNSSRTRLQYHQKLQDLGIQVNPLQIYTSSIAMASLLKNEYPHGGPLFIIGEDGLRQPLQENGFYYQENDVLGVVCGLDRQFSFDKLTKATYLIRAGAKFYGTNPDRTFPTPAGIGPGAGAILCAIEAATDTKPILAGKPSANMITAILRDQNVSPDQTIMIGDRLETDILAGHAAGCKTALMLSGISTLDELKTWDPAPDFVASNLETFVREQLLPNLV
jgi:4-nitrophenyl phosphatase